MTDPEMQRELGFRLGERVKELNALHRTARILQDDERPAEDLMAEVVRLLPGAWQYPDTTEARIRFEALSAKTPDFTETPWMQTARFLTRTGEQGRIDVCYRVEHPEDFEGPFLAEERELIESLAEMLRSFFQGRTAVKALEAARDELEDRVACRTAELKRANHDLEDRVAALNEAQDRIERYQRRLRRMASELSLTEARERRDIAGDLHDHIGQALAFIRIQIARFRGDAMFCGFEGNLEKIQRLLDQTIRYTRDLTFEISPPILFELGLESALEWLAERFPEKHDLDVDFEHDGRDLPLSEEVKITAFKAVSELLTNAVKHAGADRARLTLSFEDDRILITVEDEGRGFDTERLDPRTDAMGGFGLFSIRERIRCLGGETTIDSAPGEGTRVRLALPIRKEEA